MSEQQGFDNLLDLFNQVAGAAPEAGILYVFYAARQNNIKSGRNTSSGAQGPSLSSLSPAAQTTITSIASFLSLPAQAVINFLWGNAAGSVQNLETFAQKIAQALGL